MINVNENKAEMNNRSHRNDLNRLRARYGHKYTNIKCVSTIFL